jgi:predicted metal-binding membrane protein
MAAENANFDHLDRPGRLTAFLALRPRQVVNTIVAGAILLSWIALALLAIGAAQVVLPPEGVPGDSLLRLLPEVPFPAWAARLVSLCVTPAGIGRGGAGILFLWMMWMLMALATMLPSAAPMVRTYCEIADTAQAKGEAVAHPLVLVAGYLAVWVGASLLFASATLALAAAAKTPVAGLAAPAALTIAGLYQFSGLKEACLKKCRNPFAILFARWSSKPSRIFRLGAEQGVWCLGCCWALMLVMFAVGVMNIFWMALMALFAVVEKQWSGRVPTRLAGAILLVWAALLTVVSR